MLVGKRFERCGEIAFFGAARILERLARLHQQRFYLSLQALRARGLPECLARLLHQQLYNLATPLLNAEQPIRLLFGAVVADAEVQNIPRQTQVRGTHVAIAGSRRLQRLLAGQDAARGGSQHVIAPRIARPRRQLRQ